MTSEAPKCPHARWHGPDEPVIIGETTVGMGRSGEEGDDGSRSKRTERVIKYKDWEFRCRICFSAELG